NSTILFLKIVKSMFGEDCSGTDPRCGFFDYLSSSPVVRWRFAGVEKLGALFALSRKLNGVCELVTEFVLVCYVVDWFGVVDGVSKFCLRGVVGVLGGRPTTLCIIVCQ